MTTVGDILNYINTIAPPYMKENWDNVGLNCGHFGAAVTKVLVALDPFESVCREAADLGAELIVTHHALIWKPGFVTDGNVWGQNVLFLIEHSIAHINAHTNLDCAPDGVNDRLAQMLGLQNIQVIDPMGTDEQGRQWGLLRCGDIEEKPLEDFLGTVKTKLNCDGVRYVDGGKSVRKVAVGGGACAGEMMNALRAGCDTFVTSDAKYNQFWDAKELGINLIDAGHFQTENPIVSVLAQKLAAAFPQIEVKISESHRDCMKFY